MVASPLSWYKASMNPVVEIRLDRLLIQFGIYVAFLKRGSYEPEISYYAHWDAQRLRSVCERELGTRDRPYDLTEPD